MTHTGSNFAGAERLWTKVVGLLFWPTMYMQ